MSSTAAGTVVDFEVAIYASNGAEPAYLMARWLPYPTGGNAGQTFAGTVGIVDMYDYVFHPAGGLFRPRGQPSTGFILWRSKQAILIGVSAKPQVAIRNISA